MRFRHTNHPVLREHSVLFALIGLNTLIFIGQLVLPEWMFDDFKCRPDTVVAAWHQLLGGEFSLDALSRLLTLLSCAFLHGFPEHLIFNMLYLWIFAFLLSELLGQRWVLPIYLTTALGASVCYVVFNSDSPIPMLGASGAVMGFEGAYLGLAVRYILPNPHVWPLARPVPPSTLVIFALIGVYLDLSGTLYPGGSTAYEAHLGGFITGIFLTSFVTPMPKAARVR